MKLIKVEGKLVKRGKPSINIRDVGAISFSKEFCEMAAITVDDKVGFYQDEEKPTDWYAAFSKDETGELRHANAEKKTSLMTGNAFIARKILSSIEVYDKSITLKMSTNAEDIGGKKYYAILTKSANQS